MTRTDTLKHYGETVVESGRTGLLAAIGAGDAAVERTRSVLETVLARAEALPGEAQVQADLAVKEARTRAEQARARAAVTLRPETVRSTVATLAGVARTQAVATLAELAGRGEKLVEELYRQPVVRRVAGRTEQTVDTAAEAVEDTLAGTADAVGTASDTVTSVAQKTKARADKAAQKAARDTDTAAASTKRRVRSATAKSAKKPAVEITADEGPARPSADTTVPAVVPVATPAAPATAAVPDPTAIPAKSTTVTD